MDDKESPKESQQKEISPKKDESEVIEENILNDYIEEIIKSIEEDKKDKLIISEEDQEKTIKKKTKKVHSIDVEELNDLKIEYANTSNNPIEVKDKIFNDLDYVYKEITYAGKLFIEDRHKTNDYPKVIIYRCKNQRKIWFKRKRKNSKF